ncbi:cysteine-rich CWC family protein [Herminiimonas arsenitoxidans]|uniref:cysteine-rich CWC family protein n=1 Tax=Herminiimonas arsenitoxidans TaxID=1809410 RepID=UPI00097094BB
MSYCSQCNATFSCGMVDTTSTEACWCTALPTAAISSVVRDTSGNAKTCMCPDCLAALRARRSLEKDNSAQL